MQIADIIRFLETLAPPSLQEGYDNAGLLTGSPGWECTGLLVSLDATEEVVQDAKANGVNLIVAHHPIVFSGLKRITGKNYVERAVIASIKHDIAIYAIHTNLDNVHTGVNAKIGEKLGLQNLQVLVPKRQLLRKLVTFAPHADADKVRDALFEAGAGHIGEYSETSFNLEGTGTFKGSDATNPCRRHQDPVRLLLLDKSLNVGLTG